MPALELDRARKSFDGVVAADEISLAIPEGCIYGLLGPNGAGKTTAIRMMVGIILPDSGAVRIFGEPFKRRHLQIVGYLPEERGLYRHERAEDLLIYLGGLKGLRRPCARIRARRLAERLGIAPWLGRRVEELSKGMQQKIQLIAAMIHDPRLLIMDEPFAGLDPVNAALLMEVLLELKHAGRSVLISSHRMDQVEKLCDEICLVNRGRGVLQGSVTAVKQRFGERTVRIVYQGDAHLLDGNGAIESCAANGETVELRLCAGADAQATLRAVAAKAPVLRYETIEPSLEEIFIEVAGADDRR
ncbi:MAG TPA: ATP-binding cassette domain-containing protein [Candidatus Binataceae bacterium]|nr:ATP-binding cassette domain-containing protein [Candidatus Binataceae bacterium]